MCKEKVGHMDWERGAGEPFPTLRKMWCVSRSSQTSHLPVGWKPTEKHHSLQSSFAPQEGFVKGLGVLQEIPHPHLKLWPREGKICTLGISFLKQLSCSCLTRSRRNSGGRQQLCPALLCPASFLPCREEKPALASPRHLSQRVITPLSAEQPLASPRK